MELIDILRQMPEKWQPETLPNTLYLPDLRYVGVRSVYKITGNVWGQIRECSPTVPVNVNPTPQQPSAPRRVTAWERLLQDDTLGDTEDAKPKPTSAKASVTRGPLAPLAFVHSFDGIGGYGRTDMDWLLPIGMSLDNLCTQLGVRDAAYNHVWQEFSNACALSRMPVSRDQDRFKYVSDFELVANATANLKQLWHTFMDAVVLKVQAGLHLSATPVLVLLFMDFHLAPGSAEFLQRSLKHMGHPRLLCLLGEESV